MPAPQVVSIGGTPHMVDASALEMARRAFRLRSNDRRLGFRRIAQMLMAEGYDCQGRNTARRSACLGAWAAGATNTADVLASLNVAVDASLELVDHGAAGDRVVRRRTTTAARAAGTAVPRSRGMAARVTASVRAAVADLRNRAGTARTVGIEIEYHGNRSTVGTAAQNATAGNAAVLVATAAVGDGSVHDGAEIRGPVVRNGADGWNVYRDMLVSMTAHGARVCGADLAHERAGAHTCTAGVHVHVGADDMTVAAVRDVVMFYRHHISAIDSVITPARRSTRRHSYCGADLSSIIAAIPADSRNAVSAAGTFHTERYAAVNVTGALRSHKTIEFRQHGASLNPRKVTTWARFVCAIVDGAAAGTLPSLASDAPIGTVALALGMSASDAHYLSARAR